MSHTAAVAEAATVKATESLGWWNVTLRSVVPATSAAASTIRSNRLGGASDGSRAGRKRSVSGIRRVRRCPSTDTGRDRGGGGGGERSRVVPRDGPDGVIA